jgi:DMSO/TMAO reductase YedYZ heme-binding membrane subunit
MNRSGRNLLLGGLNAGGLLGGALWLSYADSWERISVASAWLCMVLLCSALLIGPLRRYTGKTAPLNIYLRRDLAFWSALQAFLHFYAGTVVSMDQSYVQAFVHVDLAPWSLGMRDQMFTWGASLGMAVAVVYLLLLIISSDRAMRRIRPERWKKLQKSAHLVLWLTVLHGFAFQLLEARYVPLALLFGMTVFVLVMQYQGRRRAD